MLTLESGEDLTLSFEELEASLEAGFVPYDVYYRHFGIRRVGQMLAPKLASVDAMVLPRDAVLHYLGEDDSELGIDQNNILLRDVERLIMVNHHEELLSKEGNPRPTYVSSGRLVREYLRRNRRTKILKNLERTVRDPKTLVVENYAILNHMFKYPANFYAGYYKWKNVQATLWQNMANMMGRIDRNHYLVCTLPKVIPSINELRKAEQAITRSTLEPFASPEALGLLDIWTWLGEKRENSLLNTIPAEQLDKVHLIWIESGKWFVINLGALNQWRAEQKNETKPEGKNSSELDDKLIQSYFLRMITTLYEARTVSTGTLAPMAETAIVEAKEEGQIPEVKQVIEGEKTEDSKKVTVDKLLGSQREKRQQEVAKQLQEDGVRNVSASKIEESAARPLPADVARLDRQLDTPSEDDEVEAVVVRAPLEAEIMRQADSLVDDGLYSAAQYRRMEAISQKYRELPNPFGEGTLLDLATVDNSVLKITDVPTIPDIKTVTDKSMLRSSLIDFDPRYIKEVLNKDIAACVLAMQKGGAAVTKYEVERIEDALNRYDAYTIRVVPVQGAPSTIRFRLPVVNEDGTYLANGVKCRLRKQRADMPIRKIAAGRVALTSYYSKLFVTRNERNTYNYPQWLMNRVVAKGSDPEDNSVTEIKLSRVLVPGVKVPRLYSIMASRLRGFRSGEYEFSFELNARFERYGKPAVEAAEMGGQRMVIGRKGNQLVTVDFEDNIYAGGESVGRIEDLLGLDASRAPLEVAEVSVFNKSIPVGVVLSYHLGLDNALKYLGVEPRRVLRGEKLNLSADEFAIQFLDESLVFSRRNRVASMVFAGLHQYRDVLRNYSSSGFNRKDVYFNLLDSQGITLRYIREMDMMFRMFVDPITEGILKDIGEPIELKGLLIRACELMLTDWHPEETDLRYMRIKGYERFAGAVYGEMVRALRLHNARSMSQDAIVDVHPNAVWAAIDKDPSKALVEESNPVHNLKEKELVTFAGTGGRSARSMVKRTRVFHPNDMGVISEATVDNKAVGINTYTTANPRFDSLRGTTIPYDPSEAGAASLISTSALLSPAADQDDPKRVNFINIQHSASISAEGYRATPLRTGYEQIMAHRVDDLFAYTAKGDGAIVAVEEDFVTVEYANGERRNVELGRRFGVSAGTVLPHFVRCDLKVGDKVKHGDIIAYNTNYFERDILNPKQVLWKAGVLVRTAIAESTDTLEDSSAISERVAKLMSTKVTKVRNITLKFDQTVRNLVKPGTKVDLSTILCTIEDSVTARNDLFDEDSLDALKMLGAQTPRAKFSGVVENIEVFYNGDKDDMSESLRDIASQSDKRMRRRAKAQGRNVSITGSVDSSLRVEGTPLEVDNLVIKVYITADVPAGVGDKGVFANQMKTIFGRVLSGIYRSEVGEEIDAIFGYQSISARIVLSPEVIGTTNVLLEVIGKRAAKLYKGI